RYQLAGAPERTEATGEARLRRGHPLALLRDLLRAQHRIRVCSDSLSTQQSLRGRCLRRPLARGYAEHAYVLAVRLASSEALAACCGEERPACAYAAP